MAAKIKELPWDSAFFGRKIGTVDASVLAYGELGELLATEDYDLLYVNDASHDAIKKSQIMSYSGLYMGSKVTMIATIDNFNETVRESMMTEMTENLLDLAYESGHLSRFKKDPRLVDLFPAMYKSWLEKELKVGKVFVWPDGNEPMGFVSASFDSLGCKGKIGLVAVDARARKRGVGRRLMVAALAWLKTQGVKECEIVTQGENLPAIRLYESIGFSVREEVDVYHVWRRK